MSDLLKRFNIIQDAIALGDEDVTAVQCARLLSRPSRFPPWPGKPCRVPVRPTPRLLLTPTGQ